MPPVESMRRRFGVDDDAASLAADMTAKQLYTPEHPTYKLATERMSEVLASIYDRETERKRSAKVVPLVNSADPGAQHRVAELYPEYNVLWLPMTFGVHSEWMAIRALANEHMRLEARRCARTIIHVGNNLIPTVFAGDEDVLFEMDRSNCVAVQESHQSTVDLLKLGQNPQQMHEECGYTIPQKAVRKFMRQEAWRRDNRSYVSSAKADAILFDGTLYPITVTQVLSAMVQAGATLAEVVIPFCPEMIQAPEGGEIGHTGVHYSVDSRGLTLKYPDGVSGLSRFPLAAWHEWLAVDYRNGKYGGESSTFSFELRRPRGPMLHITVVRVPDDTLPPKHSMHTLELCDNSDSMVMSGWRLRGIGYDPKKKDSWERFFKVYKESAVRKVHEFALGLGQNELHVSKIFKRATQVGARTVVTGTNVEIRPAMSEDDAHDLSVQIHAIAFEERYRSGRLTGELKRCVDTLCGFSQLSRLRRTWYILSASATGVWDALVGAPIDAMRSGFDQFRDWLSSGKKIQTAEFSVMPRFIRFEVTRQVWLHKWRNAALKWRDGVSVLANLRGALYAPYGGQESVEPDADVASFTAESVEDFFDMRAGDVPTEEARSTLDAVSEIADIGVAPANRHVLSFAGRRPLAEHHDDYARENFVDDPDYVNTLSEFHESVFPGYAQQDFSLDPSSLFLDSQDRSIAADFLQLPSDAPVAPKRQPHYASKVKAYNVEKAQQSGPGTLQAMMARNMADPQLAKGQDYETLIPAVWENFLNVACVADAREKLESYKSDDVGLTSEAYLSWAQQATPDKKKAIRALLEKEVTMFEDRDVGQYLAMLKSDAKPPLSSKPLKERVEPQVIVYHEPVLSSLFSSVFRVIRERILSLLKPNFRLNLLKGSEETRQFMRDNHPWGKVVQYLENDFSKFDKSQGEIIFMIEMYFYREVGFNQNLLDRWLDGHVNCRVRAVAIGLTLHVIWQRKSGDATTALGNGVVNMATTLYAYKGADIAWGVYMGDDSLLCVYRLALVGDAPKILAELFNLQAKFYVTQYPYFASCFVLLDQDRRDVVLVPDPVKVVERWSLAIPVKEPRWEERFTSAQDTYGVYKCRHKLAGLAEAVRNRYNVATAVDLDFQRLGDAIGTAVSSKEKFRGLRESEPYTVEL